jgi:nucleoside-diphosphate-sugar epimerase
MVSGRRLLLTGGAGFIGTALATRLLPHNEVVIFDNYHRNSLGTTAVGSHPCLKIIRGDVLDLEALRAAAAGCDSIVHLAAIAGADTVLQMPVRTMRVNLLGTMNALEVASEIGGLRRFIDFSTSEVFGTYAYKVREADITSLGAVGEARWTYAISKLATEHLAHNYFKERGLPAVSIRPFNIYGPGQVGEGAIHRFIVQALAGNDVTIHNDGSQIRAWCYIDDMVDGLLACLEQPDAIGHAFNIGNPRSVVTIHNLATQIIQLSRSRSVLRSVPWSQADVELRVPNIDKARSLLGFEPKVDLAEGLQRTIAWYRETSR